MALKNIFSGLAANLSEQSVDQIRNEFGMFLIGGEEVIVGFKLIRDVIIFTDKRILVIDKQGATGKKMRIDSIFLLSVVKVSVETADFGFDDSEISITYLTSPFLASHNPTFAVKKLEFQKKYNIQALYVMLEQLALENHIRINRLQ